MLILLLSLLITDHFVYTSAQTTDTDILLNFKKHLTNDSQLNNWIPSIKPCTGINSNWVGVRCNNDSTINKLVLTGMGLSGTIDVESLVGLTQLRTLSLEFNNFEGTLPQVNKLTSLRNLYMSNNKFSGDIVDDAFKGMNSLVALELANNGFTGNIPNSLVGLAKLTNLLLEGNQFVGRIPDFDQPFKGFNVSGNKLVGGIPRRLSSFNSSAFSGNKNLCGKPLPSCKTSQKETLITVGIIVVAALIFISIVFIIARGCRKGATQSKKSQEREAQNKLTNQGMGWKETQLPQQYEKGNKEENVKLHFVRNDRERFELNDLLRASAEVLGSGNFGSSYKAIILDGPAMVVKRFREMNNVGKAEFCEHMRRLGRLSHRNLLSLVAFYYRKEEKLLVTDFIANGSLASHLHGGRERGKPSLAWPIRLKIIKGVARGLAYLHKEFANLNLPHGHLKSSNVLLDDTFEPLLTDYALVPVVDKDKAQEVMVAYKSPEFTQRERTMKKTDVWSLGILILEMLTGKVPANMSQVKGGNADLASWVNSVVREEWTGEVFDMNMRGAKGGEGEMLKLLKIGMSCCEWRMERRWDLREAVFKIEELKERDSDTDDLSVCASEGDGYSSREVYSSRAVSEDDFSFSVTA